MLIVNNRILGHSISSLLCPCLAFPILMGNILFFFVFVRGWVLNGFDGVCFLGWGVCGIFLVL